MKLRYIEVTRLGYVVGNDCRCCIMVVRCDAAKIVLWHVEHSTISTEPMIVSLWLENEWRAVPSRNFDFASN
jgi:hypothetical protein